MYIYVTRRTQVGQRVMHPKRIETLHRSQTTIALEPIAFTRRVTKRLPTNKSKIGFSIPPDARVQMITRPRGHEATAIRFPLMIAFNRPLRNYAPCHPRACERLSFSFLLSVLPSSLLPLHFVSPLHFFLSLVSLRLVAHRSINLPSVRLNGNQINFRRDSKVRAAI